MTTGKKVCRIPTTKNTDDLTIETEKSLSIIQHETLERFQFQVVPLNLSRRVKINNSYFH